MTEPPRAEELLKEGDVLGALATLQDLVRADPADSKLRVFLFQLLCVLGAWDRALNQLNVAGDLDPQTLPMVQTYRETLRCEVLRERILAGVRQPLLFGDPERWIALALEAVRLVEAGELAGAAALRAEAYEQAPAVAGKINGEPFEWIADGDSRIGPFLEAIVNGGLYWIPFHRISKIEVHPPEDLRDLVWTAADFTWANGGEAVGFIPTRYPGSQEGTGAEYLLARRTDWHEVDAETFLGRGQRVFVTDAGEYSLLEIKTLDLDSPFESPDSEPETE